MPINRPCAVTAVLPAGYSVTENAVQTALITASALLTQCTVDDQTARACEVYLAAHFLAVADPALARTSERDPCGGSATYGFKAGVGVLATSYGQTADLLSGGCLAQLGKPKPRLYAIGGAC